MKSIIEKHLSEEFKMLWELSKKKKINAVFRSELRRHIQTVRNNLKNKGVDELAEKLSRYHNKGRWAEYKLRELSQVVYNDKRPDNIDLGKWISVEVECIFPNQDAETNFVVFVRKNSFSKFVTLKSDGSIHPDEVNQCDCETDDDGESVHMSDCARNSNRNAFGKELVITFKYGDWDLIKAVCNKLNELNCTVNKTCGLHVHFDMRHLTQRQVTTVGKRVARTIPALKQLLPKSRQNNRFCNRDINSHRDNRHGDSRYSFVNLLAYGRHRTIEFRGHSGTTDATKIINWIKILRAIMDTKGNKSIQTVSELVQSVKLETDVISYIVERYKKFSSIVTRQVTDDVTQDNRSILEQRLLGSIDLNAVLSELNYLSTQHHLTLDQSA